MKVGDYVPGPAIRVLVAEDYEPFRRFLCSTVQSGLERVSISEVADGLEAVRKAAELQPQLVLLDIGLPKLNGIEVARKIREHSPHSKILFITQESSADVMQEALQSGAAGYLIKVDAGRELMPAVDAVLRGERYVSRSLAGHEPPPDTSAPHPLERYPVPESSQLQQIQNTRRHEVGFYSDEQLLLDSFAHFVATALRSGNAAIVIATKSHRRELLAILQGYRLDMRAAIKQGRFIALDNAEVVSTFMVNGVPDLLEFSKATSELIVRAADSVNGDRARVVACGECAPLLWERGNAEGAVRLEQLWDEIAKSQGIRVLCGYPLASFQNEMGSFIFDRICAQHSAVHSF